MASFYSSSNINQLFSFFILSHRLSCSFECFVGDCKIEDDYCCWNICDSPSKGQFKSAGSLPMHPSTALICECVRWSHFLSTAHEWDQAGSSTSNYFSIVVRSSDALAFGSTKWHKILHQFMYHTTTLLSGETSLYRTSACTEIGVTDTSQLSGTRCCSGSLAPATQKLHKSYLWESVFAAVCPQLLMMVVLDPPPAPVTGPLPHVPPSDFMQW